MSRAVLVFVVGMFAGCLACDLLRSFAETDPVIAALIVGACLGALIVGVAALRAEVAA